MSDPVLPPTSDETPIDAEFEPVPKRKSKPAKKSGPSWFSFLLLGTVSVGALGLSLLSGSVFESQSDSSDLAADIERLKVDVEASVEDRAAIRARLDQLKETVTQVDRGRENDAQRLTDVSEALMILENDLRDVAASGEGVASITEGELPDMNRLVERIQALEEALQNADPIATNIDSGGSSIDAPTFDASTLEADIASLRTDVERLRDELTTLRGDLTALIEEQDEAAAFQADNAQAAEAAIALSAIETAARRGQPFQTSFQSLEEAAPDMKILDALRPLAATGASTLPDLREAFRPLKRAALKADAEDQGTTESVLSTLFGDGIRVRREGEESAADIIETAEIALITGDLEAALSALDTLPPNLQAVFTDWRQDAQNRLTLEDSLDRLRLAMIAKDRP
ncbi:MAG: hypothetical protein AAFR74_04415 [Pseudomonadota bacterium]